MRREYADVASGDLRSVSVEVDEDAGWIILSRGSVHVVANLSGRAQVVPFTSEVERVLVSWGDAPVVDEHGVGLDGHDVAVVQVR